MPRSLEYCQGYLDSLMESSWTCTDCGNTYSPIITDCPNRDIDEAQAALRAAKFRSNDDLPDDLENTATLENSTQSLARTHSPGQCLGEYCTIHNRSDHHMRAFPQHWRDDRGIMERLCPHGVGHPDPDEINPDTSHGCDGCCVPPEEREQHHAESSIAVWAETLMDAYKYGKSVMVVMLDRTVEGQVDMPHGVDHLYTVAGVTINAQYPSAKIVDIAVLDYPEDDESPPPTEPQIGTVLMCCQDGDYYYRTAKGWVNEYGDGPVPWEKVVCDVKEPIVVFEAPQ